MSFMINYLLLIFVTENDAIWFLALLSISFWTFLASAKILDWTLFERSICEKKSSQPMTCPDWRSLLTSKMRSNFYTFSPCPGSITSSSFPLLISIAAQQIHSLLLFYSIPRHFLQQNEAQFKLSHLKIFEYACSWF